MYSVDLSDVLNSVNATTATGGNIFTNQKGDAGSQCCFKSKIYVNCTQGDVNMVWR